ncbi:MAG: universal stress protein [Nitrososphaeraceae archaeon]|nr:universal stress protein [Nitrososphaeraceae archaeon]
MTIQRILVAVDGSKPSLNASSQAIDIAKKLNAELIAIYVISPDIRYNYLEDTITPRLPRALKNVMMVATQRGETHVDNVKQKAKEKGVIVKTDVIMGISSVVKEIVEYAEKNKVDMIVVGSRGLSGIKKMLVGSVASGVVTYAHCPVLVAK